ncbi:MAG: nickel-dependent lactate racemase [Chloroflexi bacterium]|nr:nickel-dependent lactate racemase [Chloroflexota bacterium]
MPSTRTEYIAYGDGYLPAQLPERTRVITGKRPIPGVPDIAEAVRNAISNPIAHEPIGELVGPKSRVTIAFDDASGAYFQTQRTDFRQVAIELIVEELRKAGVELGNIRLLLSQGLHRKLSRTEMETFLGRRLVLQFGYNNLYCHDAEDLDQLVHLGYTQRGFDVEVNRAILDSDQFIYLNAMWAPFNGGWKSTAVGLGTFRSIRHHHRPWPLASGQSVDDPKNSSFKKLVWEQGALIQKALEEKGRRIFTIETVYNNADPKKDLIAVHAGHPTEAHPHTLRAIEEQLVVDVQGQSDILVAGVSNWNECYSKFSVVNPILAVNQAMAYTVTQFQERPLVREGGIAIIVHPLLNQFDARRFAPYVEFYEKLLPQELDPYWLWENYVEEFATRPEFIRGYRYGHAYHGAHPFFMWNSTGIPRRYLSKIYFAGVKDADVARRLGFEAFATVEDAIAAAEAELGRAASITLMQRPPWFIPRVSEG